MVPLPRFVFAALLASLAVPSFAQAPSWRIAYRCDDGSRLSVAFDHEAEPSKAWVGHGGRSHELVGGATAGVYAAGAVHLRTQANEAVIDGVPGGSRRCAGEGPLQRMVIDRTTGMRFALPSSWLEQRYIVHRVRGDDARVLHPQATFAVVIEYLPQAAGLRSHPLLQLIALPGDGAKVTPAGWQWLGHRAGHGYIAQLTTGAPYPAGSADAQTFEVMRAALAEPPQRVQQAFGWLGVDEGGRTAVLAGTLVWRGRPAFKRGDELVVQLLDASRADAGAQVLAERRVPATSRPARFELRHDVAAIEPRGRYLVTARVLRNGRLLYAAENRPAVLTKGTATRPRVVLTPARGAAAPAEGGLVCQGHEPDWSLRLSDTTAWLQTPGTKTRSYRGPWERIDHLQPRVAVWRGSAGKAGAPLVAMLTQQTCVDAMGEEGQAAGTHRAVVSLPGGRVVSGCCR
nr:YbaY family lipoprotein [uncultured Caldimonas sp.]